MNESNTKALYQNPVYTQAFPDPFVLQFCGEYWAFCAGFWPDKRVFGVLHSKDLIHWHNLGGAMVVAPFAEEYSCYWAPEVIYANGKFYMYYSVGNEERMQIRVSVADHPAGPYVDSGYQLTKEEFAIDAHVFTDTDGQRYLFYATDFLTHTHIGTGTVCDQMIDLFTLAGNARPVTRAHMIGKFMIPQRAEKKASAGIRSRGPTVLKHKGRYYQMFSGGNWKNLSYGVSYASSENIETVDEWKQVADGERVLPILRTVPGSVIGPGHNSVIRGPDNRQLFCVYHFWPPGSTDRVMAVDRLEWAGERLIIIGPTVEPQPAPLVPSFAHDFNRQGSLELDWKVGSGDAQWEVRRGELFVSGHSQGMAEAVCRFEGASFLLEVSARSTAAHQHGGYGLSLTNGQEGIFRALIIPESHQAAVRLDARRQRQRKLGHASLGSSRGLQRGSMASLAA
ncbi:MAG: glycoside hydrolase family 43 protein [Pyrinomonadaceae bacterium]